MRNLTKRKDVEFELMLESAEELMKKVETLMEKLPEMMENSTKEAVGKACLVAKLNFQSMIEDQEIKLVSAGRYAASIVGNELNSKSVQAAQSFRIMDKKAFTFYGIIAVISFLSGYIGMCLAR